MVNRGEEKVRVHMNVVPRSTGNTNSGTENQLRSVNSYVPLLFLRRDSPSKIVPDFLCATL